MLVGAGHDAPQGIPAGRAVLLEEGCLRLDRRGKVGDGVDHTTRKLGEAGRRRGGLAQLADTSGVACPQIVGQQREIGVDAHTDRAAPPQDTFG